ncbi:hypothetical protein KI809_19760 [Geobacter pelophilus]|uniref:Glycosyltransferase RgtA/B/C/D-like domain-containing protein n=1 Tax=Geoanaerobacter pelophilus TaxID=60036 RepID=A0AAW4LAI8_9BACT|nr:hypothetical protein [Geoanaerobacter pelophilus]MBT0666552.1 hypothetical protein [Geoanaerobacter pelophilus]
MTENHSYYDSTGRTGVLVWIAFFAFIVACIQFSIPYPLDDDTAYHFSVARLIREHGILQSFPWTRFSWQFDHYADKEFFFHLLFVPFTPLGFNTASRIVGIIGGASILSAMFMVLRAEGVRFAGLWALIPLAATNYLYRFSQVRPHLFSIALAMLLVWAYCRRKSLVLFLLALLYPLFYVAFWQIPLILLVAAEAGRLWTDERFDHRSALIVLAGIATGVLLHPNTMNLLQINWIHMTDILFRNAWGKHVEFNMGEEFEPFPLKEWFRFMLVTTIVVIGALVAAWRDRKQHLLSTAMAITMVIFFLLTLRTNRFLEYLVPFSVLSLALATYRKGQGWLLPSLATVSLCYALVSIPLLKYITSSEQRLWQMDQGVIEAFTREVPAGADVFTCGWEYTGTLMVNLPDRNFMVALDPTLLYKRDPALYDLWYRTLKYAPPSSAEIVRRNFSSRYAICLDHPTLHPFFNALAADKGAKVLYSDGKWVLFDLKTVGKGEQ